MKEKFDGLDVFLTGELVDLCIPTETFALDSRWYSWFNDKTINRYIDQGAFPNTPRNQKEYFNNIEPDRLVLIMIDKNSSAVGVISLSFINFYKRSCEIALVVSNEGVQRHRPFMSLEAMSLMTTHAFEELGMIRVSASQHIDLKGWQNRLELLGFKIEGLHINKFVKGSHVADLMSISALYDDFAFLKSNRGGTLWDGYEKMKQRIGNLPQKSFRDRLFDFYESERDEYYNSVFTL